MSHVVREQNTSAAQAGLIGNAYGTTEDMPFPIVTPTARDCVHPAHQTSRKLNVKQTQTWQMVFLQQALVHILLLQLIDLRAGHLPAIRDEIAVGFRADRNDLFIGS